MTEEIWTFIYDIELSSEQNPPGTMDRLQEELRSFFLKHNIKYGMGALGGSRHCYGTVHAVCKQTAEDSRRILSEWVKTQRISGIARFGVATETEPSFLEPITEIVFTVENLTENDRAEAARYRAKIREWIQSQRPT